MFENNRPTLILTRGIPGSGKSTLAALLGIMTGTQFIEADHYFVDDKGNYNFNPSELGKAHEHCQNICRVVLSSGSDIRWSIVKQVKSLSSSHLITLVRRNLCECLQRKFLSFSRNLTRL